MTDPVSLPALMREEVVGSDLRLGQVLARRVSCTKYAVSYRADALTITGIMNVPAGDGPFPVVVLLHGYIDEDVYVTGQGSTATTPAPTTTRTTTSTCASGTPATRSPPSGP